MSLDVSLTFQIAFDNDPVDSSFTWTTVPGSKEVVYSRGAPNEFGRFETGESSVLMGDAASDLDPSNVDGAYYPNVRRMKPMRVFLTVDGVDYPLFQHFVERLPRLVSVGEVWTERSVIGVDAFGWFALASLKGRSYASEATGTRWANVLDDVSWPAGRRDLDAGNSTLDAATFDANAATKALEHLLDVAANENGLAFMDAEGAARFIQRHAVITDTTVVATLADGRSIESGDYPDAIPYQELRPESTDIVNDYSGKRETGAAQSASDSDSINAYGPRSSESTFIVSTDTEVLASLEWRLSQTKDPRERVDAITVMPGTDLDRWADVLGLEVGNRILVVEWPPGFSAPVETEYLIRHLEGRIPTAVQGAQFTFQLTPTDADAWLILDDATFGALDSNKLAY